jgi:uncharacterized membrane protein
MEPVFVVALLSILFFATHIGLATSRIRSALVARLGESGFGTLFSVVASLLFTVLFLFYAAHRYDGAGGLALGSRLPTLRWALMATIAAGITLMTGSLVGYPDSPYGVLGHNFREPYGLERITRHGFFVGTFLLSASHALLATHLTGTIVFSSLALLSVAGAQHQDEKLLRRGGEAYGKYLAATSMMPFAAIVSGRQRLVWQELPLKALLVGLGLVFALRAIHEQIFAFGGLLVIAAVIAGAGILGLLSSISSRSRRVDKSEPSRVGALAGAGISKKPS